MGELESGNLARQVKEMHKIINSIIKLEFEQLQNEKETIQGLIPGILKNAEKYNIAHSIESIPPNDLATQVLEIWKLQHNIGYNLGLKDGANDGISRIITMAIREPEKFQQMLSQARRQLEST
ncbi:MAG: hypothetical protein LBR09_03110 [Endomicrobium sp.]|jgi:hypothetical protein|nr:hypothetical protein [Endomicrobium sp.]